MSVADDIGSLNNASLKLGEAASLVGEADTVLDHAEQKSQEVLELVRSVKGDAKSVTLEAYIEKLRQALDEIRGSHNRNVQAIIAMNDGSDLGQDYVNKMHL